MTLCAIWHGEIPLPNEWDIVISRASDIDEVRYLSHESPNKPHVITLASVGDRFFELIPYFLKYKLRADSVYIDNLSSETVLFFAEWERFCCSLNSIGWVPRTQCGKLEIAAQLVSFNVPEIFLVSEFSRKYQSLVHDIYLNSGFSLKLEQSALRPGDRDAKVKSSLERAVNETNPSQIKLIYKNWCDRVCKSPPQNPEWRKLLPTTTYLLSYINSSVKDGDSAKVLVALHRSCELFLIMILLKEGHAWLDNEGKVWQSTTPDRAEELSGFWNTWKIVRDNFLNSSSESEKFVRWLNKSRNQLFLIHGNIGISSEDINRAYVELIGFMRRLDSDLVKSVVATEREARLYPAGFQPAELFDLIENFDVYISS